MIKKRILIVGSNGMLGQGLTAFYLSKGGYELKCCSVEERSYIPEVDYSSIDLTSRVEVKNIVSDFYPDVIINAAAFTNVDRCETEKETAWKINVDGVENLAKSANSLDAKLVHMSTDYVFDGKAGPYSEKDKVNPINYYGRTKLASENLVRASMAKSAIIRTNVLYGPVEYGRDDFVKWVIKSLRAEKKIRIVTDQINNPTYIEDLVRAINSIIEYDKEGIYNIGGTGFFSRFEFTGKIAEYFGLDESLIIPIKTEDLNQPARRPLRSGLITLKAETELGYKPLSYEDSFLLIKKELGDFT